MSIKIIATDGIDKEAEAKLKESGKVQFVSTIAEADLAIIRSATKLKEKELSELKNLKGVLRAGVGIDNIDLVAATKLGIYVWNAPTGNYQSTAELAFGLMFSVARQIPRATTAAQKGEWIKNDLSKEGRQLQGSTLGIFGAGNIGTRLGKMAHAIGMKVLVCDPIFKPTTDHPFELVDFDKLLAQSDFISIHAPFLESTKNVFNKNAFEKCKKGLMLVNAARGGIIQEQDLLEALEKGQLGGVALDVFETEPTPADSPLYQKLFAHPKVVATPHVGAATKEAQKAVGLETADKIIQIAESLSGQGFAPKSLNRFDPSHGRWSLRFG